MRKVILIIVLFSIGLALAQEPCLPPTEWNKTYIYPWIAPCFIEVRDSAYFAGNSVMVGDLTVGGTITGTVVGNTQGIHKQSMNDLLYYDSMYVASTDTNYTATGDTTGADHSDTVCFSCVGYAYIGVGSIVRTRGTYDIDTTVIYELPICGKAYPIMKFCSADTFVVGIPGSDTLFVFFKVGEECASEVIDSSLGVWDSTANTFTPICATDSSWVATGVGCIVNTAIINQMLTISDFDTTIIVGADTIETGLCP